MTLEEELAVWKQAWREQRERADSNYRAWRTTVIALLLTNLVWTLEYLWK